MSASETPIRIPLRRKIAYTAILGVALFLCCEGALRVRAWLRYGTTSSAVQDPLLVLDPSANLMVPKPGYEVSGGRIHIRINSLGFRGEEITQQKPARTVRIACLGASTTFCAEASSNDATWPARLQAKLRQAYPGVSFEVVNAAVPGYVAEDSLRNLQHRVLPLDPDAVIYYEANNEIVRDTHELARRQGLVAGGEAAQAISAEPALARYSLLFDLAYKNLTMFARSRSVAEGRLDRVPRDLPAHFIDVLERMRTALAPRETPFVLSTFLPKYRRTQARATQIANADVAFYYMPWMSLDGMLDAMDVYNQAILDYASRQHLPVVDDRDAIPADAVHYADCMHLADAGADAMADRFFRYLRESGTLDRAITRAGRQ